jgi:hypothetical protein
VDAPDGDQNPTEGAMRNDGYARLGHPADPGLVGGGGHGRDSGTDVAGAEPRHAEEEAAGGDPGNAAAGHEKL